MVFLPCTEHACTLTQDQGGGRKGHSAINQALQLVAESNLVQILKPHDGTRYLGVYVTMNGSTKPMESRL